MTTATLLGLVLLIAPACQDNSPNGGADCDGCLIAGTCYTDGAGNPDNACQICDAAASANAWSSDDSASCDDGLFCTGTETCSGGACVHSGDPCVSVGTCWEDSGGQCCAGADPTCNGDGDVVEVDSCAHEIVVRTCTTPEFACQDGRCRCEPVTNVGCLAAEKCTWLDDVTQCAADGDKLAGEACTAPATGADDCAAGTVCVSGHCAEICTTVSDSCTPTDSCRTHAGLFDDLSYTGVCEHCDPAAQDCPSAGDACYLDLYAARTICIAVPAGSVGRVQGDKCYDPAHTCYVNGCDQGYGPMIPDAFCAFFCDPVDNWQGNVQGLAGDPAGVTCDAQFGGSRPDGPGAGYECRYLQSYYSNADHIPASIGLCVDATVEGSCADFDWPQLQSDIADGTSSQTGYCTDHPERCMVSCISLATYGSL